MNADYYRKNYISPENAQKHEELRERRRKQIDRLRDEFNRRDASMFACGFGGIVLGVFVIGIMRNMRYAV